MNTECGASLLSKDRLLKRLPAVVLATGLGLSALSGCGSKPDTQPATSSSVASHNQKLAPSTTEVVTTTTEADTSTTYPGAWLGPATGACDVDRVGVPITPGQPCPETVPNPFPTTTTVTIRVPQT